MSSGLPTQRVSHGQGRRPTYRFVREAEFGLGRSCTGRTGGGATSRHSADTHSEHDGREPLRTHPRRVRRSATHRVLGRNQTSRWPAVFRDGLSPQRRRTDGRQTTCNQRPKSAQRAKRGTIDFCSYHPRHHPPQSGNRRPTQLATDQQLAGAQFANRTRFIQRPHQCLAAPLGQEQVLEVELGTTDNSTHSIPRHIPLRAVLWTSRRRHRCANVSCLVVYAQICLAASGS